MTINLFARQSESNFSKEEQTNVLYWKMYGLSQNLTLVNDNEDSEY